MKYSLSLECKQDRQRSAYAIARKLYTIAHTQVTLSCWEVSDEV